MGKILFLLSVFFLAMDTLCANGIDVASAVSTTTFNCLKTNGNTFVIVRAYRSTGAIDANTVQTLRNAKSSGLATDIYMFPCRGKNATTQVNEMTANVPSDLYSTVWIDIETNPSPGCSWSGHDATSNCNFLTEAINAVKAKGKTPGVYSSSSMWQSIFGSTTACSAAGSTPLWYAHYDNVQAFSDFKAFGGWTKPTLKQFSGDVTVCSTDLDKNWRP